MKPYFCLKPLKLERWGCFGLAYFGKVGIWHPISPNWSWWMQVETNPSGDSFLPPQKKTLQGSQAVFSENIITMHQLKMYWSVSGSRWGFAEISGSWRLYLLAVEAFINNSTQPTAQPLNFWTFWGLHVYVGKVKFKRIFQHTPGTHPRPLTNSLWRNSFHLGFCGCLGYATGVWWGPHRKKNMANLHQSSFLPSWNRPLKSRPSGKDLIFD